MLAGMRLVRRLGLAVGALILACNIVGFIAVAWGSSQAKDYEPMIGIGAAILAFFLPRVEATSFSESNKESA